MSKVTSSLGVGLVLTFCLAFIASAEGHGPTSVGISNLTDSSFTVTWWTNEAESGQVQLVNGASYDDVRGPTYAGVNHYVNVDGLKPGTDYTFDLVANGERFDQSGRHWQVTTGNVLAPRAHDFIRGRVKNADGSSTANVIVYVMLERLQHGTVSGLESTLLLQGQDTFQIDLARARLFANPEVFFEYSVQGDRYLNNGVNILAMSPDHSGVVLLDLGDPRLRTTNDAEMLVLHLTASDNKSSETTPTSTASAAGNATNTPIPTALPTLYKPPHLCPRTAEDDW